MNNVETVNNYTDKIEQLHYKLCDIYTSNKTKEDARAIQGELNEHTLGLYIL